MKNDFKLSEFLAPYKDGVSWEVYDSKSAAVGWIILFFGIAVPLCLSFGFFELGIMYRDVVNLNAYAWIIGAISLSIFMSARWISRRFFIRDELDLALADSRSPVIFLRPFSVDSLTAPMLGESTGFNVFYFGWRWSIQAEIYKQIGKFAPVLCIGRPGESLPPVGPVRIYVNNNIWQTVVANFFEVATLIFVWPGSSTGIEWELEEISKRGLLYKLVIITVNAAGEPLDKSGYLDLRQRLDQRINAELPTNAWHSWFLWFDKSGKAHAIDTMKPGGGKDDFDHALGQLKDCLNIGK